jgi:hypothetical protein
MHPSAAFLMASQRRVSGSSDDSSSDSIEADYNQVDENGQPIHVHPLFYQAQTQNPEDDSFNDDSWDNDDDAGGGGVQEEENTDFVFRGPLQTRGGNGGGGLHLPGIHNFDDDVTGSMTGRIGGVPETPTPASGGGFGGK